MFYAVPRHLIPAHALVGCRWVVDNTEGLSHDHQQLNFLKMPEPDAEEPCEETLKVSFVLQPLESSEKVLCGYFPSTLDADHIMM